MKSIFDNVSKSCSKIVTEVYSSSFSNATKILDKSIRNDIYNIYGFVRLADEIVDGFNDYDKEKLFDQFEKDLYKFNNLILSHQLGGKSKLRINDNVIIYIEKYYNNLK